LLFLISLSGITQTFSQHLIVGDKYLEINANAHDPLYTTYAASMERSQLYGDKAYKMDYYSESEPLAYYGDQAGRFYTMWLVDKLAIDKISRYYIKPVVKASFPDLAILEYQPFENINVQETFFVYSSGIAMVNMVITNESEKSHLIDLYPVLEIENDSLNILRFVKESNTYFTNHYETKKRLISNLYSKAPYQPM